VWGGALVEHPFLTKLRSVHASFPINLAAPVQLSAIMLPVAPHSSPRAQRTHDHTGTHDHTHALIQTTCTQWQTVLAHQLACLHTIIALL